MSIWRNDPVTGQPEEVLGVTGVATLQHAADGFGGGRITGSRGCNRGAVAGRTDQLVVGPFVRADGFAAAGG